MSINLHSVKPCVDGRYRFPRLVERPEDAKFARLEADAFRALGSLSRSRRELGQIFLALKAKLKHGEWQPYYMETFGESGVPYRSATRYMKQYAEDKKASLAVLKSGTSQNAANIDKATKKVKAIVGAAPKPGPPVYRLALHLNAAQREATILLWSSKHRDKAEKEHIELLRKQHLKYSITTKKTGTA
jgi:hypothetical protein